MKKIINNPKVLILLTNILLVISILYNIFVNLSLKINDLFSAMIEYAMFGSFITLVYFLVIIFKQKVKLKLLNTILFINYSIVLLMQILSLVFINNNYNYFSILLLFTKYIIFFAILLFFLGVIFYSKQKKIIKPNLLTILCSLIYFICLFTSINNIFVYGIPKINIVLIPTLSTIYFIPMILYFRLYALNILRKRKEEKNEG